MINEIREMSVCQGIDMVGFTDLYDGEYIKAQVEKRVSMQMDTEFDDVDIQDRMYPERLLEGWKSIISFGLSYNFDLEESSGEGVLSRCSLGVDYHRVLKSKIEAVLYNLSQEYEFKYTLGVDTTPLLDREIARLSGLGYQGKNTNIINKSYGSFIFLGYALVDIGIKDYSYSGDYIPKTIDGCGSCEICQKACPTNSVNGDYTINSRTCLAYITQTKGKIPYDARYKMGNRIYGCDTCQDVCPKNRKVFNQADDVFAPIYVSKNVDLQKLATITNREFKETYGRTSSGWRGKNLLRRNAVIAMGNTGDRAYLEVLRELMLDSSDMVAEYALWAILNIDLGYGKSLIEKSSKKIKAEVRDEVQTMIRYIEEK